MPITQIGHNFRYVDITDLMTGAGGYDVIINCSNYDGDYIQNDWIIPIICWTTVWP